jgi:hypothetical protein
VGLEAGQEGDLHDEVHERHEGEKTHGPEETSIASSDTQTVHERVHPLRRERGVSEQGRRHWSSKYLLRALVVVLFERHWWCSFQFPPSETREEMSDAVC